MACTKLIILSVTWSSPLIGLCEKVNLPTISSYFYLGYSKKLSTKSPSITFLGYYYFRIAGSSASVTAEGGI